MERVRARCCLAVGAIALAMAAPAAGAVAAPPRDLTADVAHAAGRGPVSPGPGPVLDDEEHPDPTPPPSEEPGAAGDLHGMDATPSDDPHGGMEDPAHGDETPSPDDPMDMGDHMADPSPSAAPGHGHGAEPSPEPAASDDHGMDDQESASHEPSPGSHDDAPANGHDDSVGGHGDEQPAEERPRVAVLGGFVALNGIALAGAAVLRRRDRAAAALKARRTPTTQPEKDAFR